MKKKVSLKKGTFVDIGSLKRGERACFIDPDGRMIYTSPVKRYLVAAGNVWIETRNTFYYRIGRK